MSLMNAWHLHNFVVIFPLFIVDTAHQLSYTEEKGVPQFNVPCTLKRSTRTVLTHAGRHTGDSVGILKIDERYLKITLKTIANGFKVSRGSNERNEHICAVCSP